MNTLAIQIASCSAQIPNSQQFQAWVDIALADQPHCFEVVIRIVDEAESADLNQQYRHKTGPTNILSFPFELPDHVESDLLGDLVICAPVVEQEAITQHKPLLHHWAHIVIHGILHLRGYDHINDAEAEEMENKEITLLQQLNINNPY